jgi:uncharacterized protein YycO
MIKIRFVDGPGIVSDFIKFWTWSEWSHVDVWTPNGWLGARSNGGVQIRPWDYTKVDKEEIRAITLDDATETNIMNWFHAQIGKPYDFLAIAGMPFRQDWRSDKRWFCSELVAAGFQQAGVELLDVDHLNRVTPRDLYLSPLLKAQ